jgi:hypothetical protein
MRVLPARLSRPTRDGRSAEEFLAALQRETDASLRRDPARWTWAYTPQAKARARAARSA